MGTKNLRTVSLLSTLNLILKFLQLKLHCRNCLGTLAILKLHPSPQMAKVYEDQIEILEGALTGAVTHVLRYRGPAIGGYWPHLVAKA